MELLITLFQNGANIMEFLNPQEDIGQNKNDSLAKYSFDIRPLQVKLFL
jgi:hypothetical protein